MRVRATAQFLDAPTGTALIALIADWWIEAEGLMSAADGVDHRADAARARYTRADFDARIVAVPLTDRSERRAAMECFEAFAAWASSHAARQVNTWLRQAVARPAEPLRPEKVQQRVRREITAAIRPAAGARRIRGPAAEAFDAEGNLDYVIETGRTQIWNGP